MKRPNACNFLVLFLLLFSSKFTAAQKTDSTERVREFGGNISVTNNGISFIPSFSLEKPALITEFSMGHRLYFEPQLRFALEGKPWSFIFWWRYKMQAGKKLKLTIGAHPALSFKNVTAEINGTSKNIMRSSRYVAGELAPNYFLMQNISIGTYYLYAYCLEPDAIRHTHFLTINARISNIRLFHQLYLHLAPQMYYLKMGKQDGFYCSSTITLSKQNFPFSLGGIVNKAVHTEIATRKNLIWNISLAYSFKNSYSRL